MQMPSTPNSATGPVAVEVLDSLVLYESGGFRRVRYWLRGLCRGPSALLPGLIAAASHSPRPSSPPCTLSVLVSYILGCTGGETVVEVESVGIQTIAPRASPLRP